MCGHSQDSPVLGLFSKGLENYQGVCWLAWLGDLPAPTSLYLASCLCENSPPLTVQQSLQQAESPQLAGPWPLGPLGQSDPQPSSSHPPGASPACSRWVAVDSVLSAQKREYLPLAGYPGALGGPGVPP